MGDLNAVIELQSLASVCPSPSCGGYLVVKQWGSLSLAPCFLSKILKLQNKRLLEDIGKWEQWKERRLGLSWCQHGLVLLRITSVLLTSTPSPKKGQLAMPKGTNKHPGTSHHVSQMTQRSPCFPGESALLPSSLSHIHHLLRWVFFNEGGQKTTSKSRNGIEEASFDSFYSYLIIPLLINRIITALEGKELIIKG